MQFLKMEKGLDVFTGQPVILLNFSLIRYSACGFGTHDNSFQTESWHAIMNVALLFVYSVAWGWRLDPSLLASPEGFRVHPTTPGNFPNLRKKMEFDVKAVVSVLLTAFCALVLNVAIGFMRKKRRDAKLKEDERNKWWKEGIIYHIYPRSFQDSSGDGNGDLRGILQRMDYIEYLGVSVLYLSPIFKSPMIDNGYDISNYNEIDPLFGSYQDFDNLLKACHKRGLKLVLDFVPNHTSNMHPWFVESRSSRVSPKRAWYVWRDPAPDGGPPNNWVSVFGGSAWTYDENTGQYYLHQFCPEQPDLNFRNPDVCQAMLEVMKFWLDKGVDGFRVDAVSHLLEDDRFRDEPTNDEYDPSRPKYDDLIHKYTSNLKGNHTIVQQWRECCNAYPNHRLLIGEVMASADVVMKYYGRKKAEFDFPFNFGFLGLDKGFNARDVHSLIDSYLKALPSGCWPNWLLGNHDVPRVGSRISEEYLQAMNVLVLTLPGTVVTYYGEEIGMIDAKLSPGREKDLRDPQRSPMQWTNGQNAGFSTNPTPWISAMKGNYQEMNVKGQKRDPCSMLNLYRDLVLMRSTHPAFKGLDFKIVHVDDAVLAYTRGTVSSSSPKYLIIINFGKEGWRGATDGLKGTGVVVLDSTRKSEGDELSFHDLFLNASQALIISIY